MSTELSDREREMLVLERLWWQFPGVKANEIRRRFDWSTTQYYQALGRLIVTERALAADPVLVRRLLRVREARRR